MKKLSIIAILLLCVQAACAMDRALGAGANNAQNDAMNLTVNTNANNVQIPLPMLALINAASHSTRTYACKKCTQTFDRKEDLKAHKQNAHPKTYTCTQCTHKPFASRQGLVYHIQSSHNSTMYQCPECSAIFKQLENYREHWRLTHKLDVHACTQCPMRYTKLKSLEDHIQRKHSQPVIEVPAIQPPQINQTSDAMNLDVNTNNVQLPPPALALTTTSHAMNLDTNVNANNVQLPLSMLALINATASHGAGMHQCDQCAQKFDRDEYLRAHKRNDHKDEIKTYTCSYQGCTHEPFTSYNGLKFHMEGHNPNGFKCNACDKTFAREVYRSDHVRLKHPSLLHPCNQCSKRYILLEDLDAHVRTNHA